MPDSGARDSGSPDGGDLAVADLALAYTAPDGRRIDVLQVAAFAVPAGSTVGITGPSGSGKTSFLHVIAGIERPTSGSVSWGPVALSRLKESARDAWRRRNVGLVFQDFHLVPGLSVRANVLLPIWLDHVRVSADMRARADRLIAAVGLTDPQRKIEVMSRGEQQRVAVARALLRRPRVLLADEPTASLDTASAATVGELLVALAHDESATLIVVSHDQALLARLERVWRLNAGQLEPWV
jgi:putative ABC transport system ATP-binding protein